MCFWEIFLSTTGLIFIVALLLVLDRIRVCGVQHFSFNAYLLNIYYICKEFLTDLRDSFTNKVYFEIQGPYMIVKQKCKKGGQINIEITAGKCQMTSQDGKETQCSRRFWLNP